MPVDDQDRTEMVLVIKDVAVAVTSDYQIEFTKPESGRARVVLRCRGEIVRDPWRMAIYAVSPGL